MQEHWTSSSSTPGALACADDPGARRCPPRRGAPPGQTIFDSTGYRRRLRHMNNATPHRQACEVHRVQFHDGITQANPRFYGTCRHEVFVATEGEVSDPDGAQ